MCLCDCGNTKVISSAELRQGKTKSCGCWLIESAKLKGYNNKTHGGYSKTASEDFKAKIFALSKIKERSEEKGYKFDLQVGDLPSLPDKCPVFNVLFKKGTLKDKDASPSIDRLDPQLPYLKIYKNNLYFISHRANRIKKDATLEELEKIYRYVDLGILLFEDVVSSETADIIKSRTLQSIRNRARHKGYESDLEISDLPILTNRCPILGIPYTFDSNRRFYKSPSIDRKNTNLPYLKKYKDNLFYISWRANAIKSDASKQELLNVIQYMKQRISS